MALCPAALIPLILLTPLHQICRGITNKNDERFQTHTGAVKIAYFHKGFLSLFLFLYKLGAILDF